MNFQPLSIVPVQGLFGCIFNFYSFFYKNIMLANCKNPGRTLHSVCLCLKNKDAMLIWANGQDLIYVK